MADVTVAANKEAGRQMGVQSTKSKAEQALAEGFAEVASRLPGNAAVAEMRRASIGAFVGLGLPTRRVEAWKYTDLRARLGESFPRADGGALTTAALSETLRGTAPGLLPDLEAYTMVFVDGLFVTSTLPKDASGVEVMILDTALESMPGWVQSALQDAAEPADGVVALNTAYMTGGVALRLADGKTLDKPLHLVFSQSGHQPKMVTTRVIVSVGREAKLTLIETHVAIAEWMRQQNTLLHLTIGDAAEVAHVKNLTIDKGSVHLSNCIVHMGAKAAYTPFQLTTGDGLVRYGLDVRFDGQHGSFDLGALALPGTGGHVDTTMVIDHAVPHCTSRELYKCVLDGHARGIFQGKVVVRPGAQKTDGKQMAQALMLSPDAEFDSKPELEIYADDVVCGHGSTSAELDDDLLFYCQSRGIPAKEARALLIESFIGEVIDKVAHEGVRAALQVRAAEWLRDGHL